MTMRLTFDRGTILLEDPPGRLDPGLLPGVVWDPRVNAFRAPAMLHATIEEALRLRGIEFSDEARSRTQPDTSRWRTVDLRPYQQAALWAWESRGRRGTIALPAGSGKTRIAIAAMSLSRIGTLCLVPTRVLLHQWSGEIESFRGSRPALLGDGFREIGPLTVSTFESALRHMAGLGDRFDLLVVDEVHHFGTGARDEALEMCVAKSRMGLSATPPAGEPARRIARLVGPTVFRMDVASLAGSWLSDFRIVTLELDLDPAERARYEAEVTVFRSAIRTFRRTVPEASFQDFSRAASMTDEGRRALGAWRRSRKLVGFSRAKASTLGVLLQRHRNAKVLVFTHDNATAYRIARRHLVMPLTCDIRGREREEVLSRFRGGALRALVSSQVLNEGLDVPDADVGIIVGSTGGSREYVQRVGRVLRPSPGKQAVVYDLVTPETFETKWAEERARELGSSDGRTV